MNKFTRTKIMGTLFVVFVVVITALPSVGAKPAQPASQSVTGGPPVVLLYDPTPSNLHIPPPPQFSRLHAQSATITVNYLSSGQLDGDTCEPWPSEAQTAFNYAASIWESLINSSVPIEINACWTSFGDPLILGSSRAVSHHGNFTGAPEAFTWYQVSLANALNGTDLNDNDGPDSDGDGLDADADMNIKYNKDRTDWYFGVDGSPGGSELDFASVALHEICHGLGFAGSMVESSGLGYWGWGISSYPTIYDHFTEKGGGGTGTPLLSYTNGSTQLGSALTSQDIFFDGPNTNAANGGTPPELYAPPTWQPGSSYSHLDESYNPTANALMTYSIGPGESEHSPGSVTFGILQDVGWNIVTYPDVGIVKQVVGGSDLVPGDPITFTLSIANSGGVVAANTVVTDIVPSEVLTPTFASTLAVTQTGVVSYVWNIEPLGVGESGVITIYGWIDPSLDSDSSFDNTATISDPEDNTPGNNTSSVTVGVRKVYLPLVVRNYPVPPGPDPGFWESATGDEFYVTTDRAYVDNFAVYINVSGCGIYKITHNPLEPIISDQFSFSGSFYASGTFNSKTTASGTDGLSSFYIAGCGYISGGPWSWNATWQNSSQPTIMIAEVVEPGNVEPVTTDNFHTVIRIQ